jgi:hypothetical protein
MDCFDKVTKKMKSYEWAPGAVFTAHLSLFRKSVNYGRKKFYNIGPGTIKLFMVVIISESL